MSLSGLYGFLVKSRKIGWTERSLRLLDIYPMGFGKIFGEQIELARNLLAKSLDHTTAVQTGVNFDWDSIEDAWSVHFSNRIGRLSKSPLSIAGLMMISYLKNLSDEYVVEDFTLNTYYQFLCGEMYLSYKKPCHSSTLRKWRDAIGEEDIATLLSATIKLAIKFGFTTEESIKRVIVDTKVMEKDITYPTDQEFLERARSREVERAYREWIKSTFTYNRKGPKLFHHAGRFLLRNKFQQLQDTATEQKRLVTGCLKNRKFKISWIGTICYGFGTRQNWEFRPNHTKYCSKFRVFKLLERKITLRPMEYADFSIFFKHPLRSFRFFVVAPAVILRSRYLAFYR